MINQLEIIENDLKQLQSEVNKKQPALKETLTHALVAVMNFKNSKDKDNADQFSMVFPLVASTKNTKMITQSLSLLQNMLNYGYFKSGQLLPVMAFFNGLLEIQDDNIHLKVLQMMLICITPKYLDFNEFDLIEKLLNLIIQMYNSKNVMIQSPASAALSQLSSLIFEQFINYVKANKSLNTQQTEERPELSHGFYQKSLKLMKDFIMIANGHRPDWSPPNASIPKNVGFDLMNDIIKQTSQVLKLSKEAHQLIRKDFIPPLMQNFDSKNQDFIGLLRTLKAASRILVALDDGLELIDQIISLLNRSEQEYERYLCIEAFHVMCSSPDLMVTLNERHSSNGSYFTEILNSIVKVCIDIYADIDFNKKKSNPLNPKLFRILDSNFTEFETPQITSINIYKSSSDCLATITQTLFVLAEKYAFNLKTTHNIASTHEQKNLIEWLNINWKPMLKVLKSLLAKEVDESLTQNILNVFQKMINLFGSLNLAQARDSFVISICQACLPQGDDRSLKELTLKNIQTTKTVFNIAHCLGGILDINSWHSVLSTLQKTEILFDRIRNHMVVQPPTPSTKSTSPHLKVDQDKNQEKTAVQRLINQENESSLHLDLEILASALDSLFTQSSTYPIDHFKRFLEAIHQLSLDYLEKATSPDVLIIEGVNIEGKMKIFGLSRMLEAILVNIERIDQFWDLVLAHYVCVTTNSKNLILRNRGVDNLNVLIEKLFQYFANKKDKWENENKQKKNKDNPDNSNENHKEIEEGRKGRTRDVWTKESWQHTLFQPWLEISKTRFADIKENVCGALLKLLQSNGHEIDQNGWKSISLILLEVSQDSVGSAARIGFKCLEAAVGDYLQDFDIESVKTLVEVIENFKNVSIEKVDNNISYQSIGMFWKIGDYIAKLQEQEQKKGKAGIEGFEEVWMFILNRLIADAHSDHVELRTSAIHTFANLMIHHGNSLGSVLWNKVISKMIFKLIDELLEAYVDSNRDESPIIPGAKDQNVEKPGVKKWEDTLAVLMQNLIKMMKKYLLVIEKIDGLNAQSQEIVVLRSTLNKLKGIIMVARNELITESSKFLHEIISTKPEILSFVVDAVFDIFEIIKSFLVEVRQNGREIKIILNKFIPEMLEILREQYDPKRYKALNPEQVPYARILFGILEKAIFYSKQAETFNSITPNARIMIDVKPIYDFLESIPSTLCEDNEDMISQYFQFIINVLSYPVTDKFTDVVVRKIITILDDVLSKRVFSDSIYLPYLPKIIEKMGDILCLRSNNEFLALTGNTLKNTLPIWLYMTDYFHKIIGHFLEDFRNEAKRARETNTPLSEEVATQHSQLAQQIIEIYEKILKEGHKNIGNISKGVFTEIKKDWLDMDMKFISSIANTLVPNFAYINYNLLWRLINILDTTLALHSKNPVFLQPSTSYSSSASHISKTTLEILFKIIDVYQELAKDNLFNLEAQDQKANLTKYATQKLVLKCKTILMEYIYDENRSGNMPLPRVRNLEICDILEKLRKLKILPNTFLICQSTQSPHKDSGMNFETEELEEDKYVDFNCPPENFEELSLIKIFPKKNKNESLVQGPKGHLVYLMPIFSEFITCKDAELKVLLKKIFTEISREVI